MAFLKQTEARSLTSEEFASFTNSATSELINLTYSQNLNLIAENIHHFLFYNELTAAHIIF